MGTVSRSRGRSARLAVSMSASGRARSRCSVRASSVSAPPRRAAMTPPARSTRTTATARPSLRLRDIVASRAAGGEGHGAEVPDLEVDATIELLALLAWVVAEGRLVAESHDLH